jgi:hypothetical protein
MKWMTLLKLMGGMSTQTLVIAFARGNIVFHYPSPPSMEIYEDRKPDTV